MESQNHILSMENGVPGEVVVQLVVEELKGENVQEELVEEYMDVTVDRLVGDVTKTNALVSDNSI